VQCPAQRWDIDELFLAATLKVFIWQDGIPQSVDDMCCCKRIQIVCSKYEVQPGFAKVFDTFRASGSQTDNDQRESRCHSYDYADFCGFTMQ